jgi:hypothetical protein
MAECEERIEITPAMIEAGTYAAREHCLGSPLSDLAHAVYVAMVTEAVPRPPPRVS